LQEKALRGDDAHIRRAARPPSLAPGLSRVKSSVQFVLTNDRDEEVDGDEDHDVTDHDRRSRRESSK